MKLPAIPQKGDPKPDFFRDLDSYLRATRIVGIAGGWVRETPNGTTLIPTITAEKRGGGTAAPDAPWTPSFFTEGEGETLVYKCRFNLGTVNQVVASNWNDAQTLSMAADAYHFVVLTITTASGKVTGVSIGVDATAPSEDYIAKDTPPVTFKIVLGAIGRTEAKMIVLTNLEAAAEEVFRESDAAPATGAEPFHRWWRWNVEAA